MKFARIENGTVIEVIEGDPAGRYHPSILWTEVPPAVTPGSRIVDGQWEIAPPPDPALPPPAAPAPAPDLLEAALVSYSEAAVQAHLDARAAERNYDSIHTAAIRAGFAGPFQAEGLAYAQWMDACWAHCYQVLADARAGSRPAPSPAELIAELPALTLP